MLWCREGGCARIVLDAARIGLCGRVEERSRGGFDLLVRCGLGDAWCGPLSGECGDDARGGWMLLGVSLFEGGREEKR